MRDISIHLRPESAKQEWKQRWPIPIASMIGIMTCGCFSAVHGILALPMLQEFGWTRAEFFSAFTLQMMLGIVIGPFIGRLIDRVGSRRIALTGLATFLIGFSMLGTAQPEIMVWRLLCMLQGLGTALLTPPVWMNAVTRCFDRSRGLALSVALAGTGLANVVWPLFTVTYLSWFGWRATFPALAVTAILVLAPITFYWFHPDRSTRLHASMSVTGTGVELPPVSLFSMTFILLLAAGGLFASVGLGLMVHLAPILTEKGLDLSVAAGFVAVAGFGSIIGRIVTGYLLDRLPTSPVGVLMFSLPVVVSLMFWQGESRAILLGAAALLGFVTGAEADVLYYIASRRIGRSVMATAFAILSAFLGATASMGPLLAGVLRDWYHSYDAYLLMTLPCSAAGALFIGLIPIVAQIEQKRHQLSTDKQDS